MNIETLNHTGLTQSELAELFGVSRITVNSWLRGRFAPHKLHRDHIVKLAQGLEKAREAGKFPIPLSVPKAQRIVLARAAIEEHI